MARVSSGTAALAGAIVWIVLVASPLRQMLESRLVTHVLIELPGLIVAGALIGMSLRAHLRDPLGRWNRHGATGLAVALAAALFWMLPRWLDASLESDTVAVAKVVSLPLLIGLPLALSWPLAGAILRGFIKANLISMALVLGWLYTAAPIRLCNNYLIDDQVMLGTALLLIAGALGALWALPLFVMSSSKPERNAVMTLQPFQSKPR